jgi:hypothetical protein
MRNEQRENSGGTRRDPEDERLQQLVTHMRTALQLGLPLSS